MKFVGTKKASPVIYGNDVPHERDLYWVKPEEIPTKIKEYQLFLKDYIVDRRWWDKQFYRCHKGYVVKNMVDFNGGDIFIDGFNVEVQPNGSRYIPHIDCKITNQGDLWIPPKMYFYLNFWNISKENKITGRKSMDHPDFTDLSFENWMLRYKSWKAQLDILWAKCRQRGLSEEEAADTGYDFLFYNDIQIAIVGGLDIYNNNTFNMVKRGIGQLYNTQFYKEIKKNDESLMTTKNTGSEIHSRTAKDNKQILSGLNRLIKAHLEEIGIMKKGMAPGIAEFIKPSIKTRGRNRTGFISYVGTSGIYADGVEDMETMLYNPDKYELLSIPNVYDKNIEPGTKIACFIPAWKFRIRDDDGNSLKTESIKDVQEERASKLPKDRAILIAAEPLETREMFDITSGGYFGDDIIHHCNVARSRIIMHSELQIVERGFLVMKNPSDPLRGFEKRPWDAVEWISNNEEGDIGIAEKPQRDSEGNAIPGLYDIATDSYDQDESKTSSSKLACGVYKNYNTKANYEERGIFNNFVALYLDRPSVDQGGRNEAYSNSAKLTLWYTGYNMIEYSKILIFQYYEDFGLEGFLRLRPDFVISNMVLKSEVSNKYGFPGALVPQALVKLKDWLMVPENIDNCPFEEMLKAWARFKIDPKYNCDITIMSALGIVSVEDTLLQLKGQTRKENQKMEQTFKGYKTVNGILKAIYA